MKMQLNGALILAGILALSTQVHAQEEETQAAESTTKLENVSPNLPEQKAGEDDVDSVITNRKLRAETGSKSKYSFSTALSYSGGTISNPGSDTRPKISSATYAPIQPALGGSLGAKYKISALQSLSADIGVTIYRPFHSDKNKSFGQRTTVADPSVSYQVVYKTAGIQNVTSLGLGYTTNKVYREAIGQVGGISASQTAIYDFGGSSWSVGLVGAVDYTAFDKDKDQLDEDGVALGESQADYSFAFYPFAEVTISEKLNLRTVFRPFTFSHVRSGTFGQLVRDPYTQSVGIGISVTRDIYLYPNVQFAPFNLQADRTNVGMSLNLNI